MARNSVEGMCNTAGPFGLAFPFFMSLGVFFLAGTFFLFEWWIEPEKAMGLLWLLLFSAGMSNVLERLLYGCVFDFFVLPGGIVCNVADILLTASVVFLLWKRRWGKKNTF